MTGTDRSDGLRELYADWTQRMAANPAMTLPEMRALFDEWHQASAEPELVSYAEGAVGGVAGIWCLPAGADSAKVVVYLHGGGFVVGGSSTHRKVAGHLAAALGVTAFVLDYRRAPEHPFPAQVEDATAVLRALYADGFAPEDVVTAGDSAGGNLAVSCVLKLREDGASMPGAVIALSPWVDMEHLEGTLDSNAATDALVQREVVTGMSTMFLGEGNDELRRDPLANPLHADFAGFPRLYIDAGGAETLLDNAEKLADRAKASGVDVTLTIAPEQQHVYPMMAGRARVADDEIARIAAWYGKGAGA